MKVFFTQILKFIFKNRDKRNDEKKYILYYIYSKKMNQNLLWRYKARTRI
jgi:hypothetical protein